MKKITASVIFTVMILLSVSARDINAVPNGGDSIYELSSPTALTDGSSVTGGAIFNASPESLIVNPALISREQRVKLNLADTFIFSVNGENAVKAGDAFQAGIIVPFKMFVLGGYFNGTFVNLDEMNLGNSFTLKAALSKDIADKLAIGAGLSGGMSWTSGFDWNLSADLGFVFYQGNVGFMKDFRYGASILNLGKCFGQPRTGDVLGYPTLGTFKAGASASFIQNKYVDFGWAFDITTPLFQNLIIDAGLKLCINDQFVIAVNEKFNLTETIRGNYNFIPSVSLSYRFFFGIHKTDKDDDNSLASYMARHDWTESEFSVSAGYKNFYQTAHAVSIGADLSLGLKDTKPPVIQLWDGEEDDEDDDE